MNMDAIEPREQMTAAELVRRLELAAHRLDNMPECGDLATACYQAVEDIGRLTKELKDANELVRLMAEKVPT